MSCDSAPSMECGKSKLHHYAVAEKNTWRRKKYLIEKEKQQNMYHQLSK